MPKVFLGGTCNESNWRDALLFHLTIDYFNPVVENWTEEAKQEELLQRKSCDKILYVITPRMSGVYSIAELIDDSNKRPQDTIFCILKVDLNDEGRTVVYQDGIKLSLEAVAQMAESNGAKQFTTLTQVADYLNSLKG